MKIKYLSGKKNGTVAEIEDVQAKSLIEDGIAEEVQPDALDVALKGLEGKIEEAATKAAEKAAHETVAKISKGLGKVKPTIVVGADRATEDPTGGYKHLGEFLMDVKNWSNDRSGASDKLKPFLKSTTGNTEGAAPDAGPTVPVAYTSEIFQVTGGIPDFWQYVFKVPVQTSSVKIPVLKNYNRANTTAANGVVATVTSEAAAITQSKTNWEQLSLSLAKETIVVPASNELLEDNIVSLGAVIAKQADYQIKKAVNRGILQGSSALTGIIGHASAVAVAEEASQAAGTLNFANIAKMYAAFAHDDADYNNAVWFVHPTVLPALFQLTSGNYNVYTAPGAANDTPSGKLFGRPLIVTGQANTLGTSGDIVLADLSKYVGIYKGGMNTMVSPHVFFLTDEQAFRFTLRIGGKPGLSGAITLEDGSTTVSPFVTLATRA